MSTPDLERAAQALRDSVAALTEGERYAGPWQAGGIATVGDKSWWVGAGTLSIANAGLGDSAKAAAEHIARTASPDVVAAVADMLDSVRAALPWIDSTPGRSSAASILSQRANALARVILGGDDAH